MIYKVIIEKENREWETTGEILLGIFKEKENAEKFIKELSRKIENREIESTDYHVVEYKGAELTFDYMWNSETSKDELIVSNVEIVEIESDF